MKINNANDTVVERDGLTHDGTFKIQFNAKMAAILSNGLYSDKIQSIIRELSCNALDSHVEAGYAQRPIEVHLPTVFEPWFHVRDFGVGLDHDQVIDTYTCYGASTKTNSNDVIGQLGLGCKSPFSYVDAFDVTAIKDGVERQYSMYKNESGMPSVALMGEKKTKEANGVTVKMPVLQNDFRNFIDKATNVFRWFDVQPTVVGVSKFAIEKRKVFANGSNWTIFESEGWGYRDHSHSVALMGRVAYPLDANSIDGLNDMTRALLGMNLAVTFNIGDLEIAASREALGYDKRTQANIRIQLEKICAELAAQLEKKIADAKTEWEARSRFRSIFQHSAYSHSLERILKTQGLKWNGKVINSSTISVDLDVIKFEAINTIYSNYKRCRPMRTNGKFALTCSKENKVIFDDLPRGGTSRVAYWHSELQDRYDTHAYIFGPSAVHTWDEIRKLMGDIEVMWTSQMPKRPSVSSGERVSMLEWQPGGWQTRKSDQWTSTTVELDDGGIYVALDRYDVVDNDKKVDNFKAIVSLAQRVGVISTTDKIYSPRGAWRKKVEQHADWTNLFDMIRDHLKTKLTDATKIQIADAQMYKDVCDQIGAEVFWNHPWKFENKNSMFAQFVDSVKILRTNSKSTITFSNHIELDRLMGNTTQTKSTYDALSKWKEILQHYPMLILLQDYYDGYRRVQNHLSKINDYINMVDAHIDQQLAQSASNLLAA